MPTTNSTRVIPDGTLALLIILLVSVVLFAGTCEVLDSFAREKRRTDDDLGEQDSLHFRRQQWEKLYRSAPLLRTMRKRREERKSSRLDIPTY